MKWLQKSGRLQGACCFLPFEIVLLLVEDTEEGEVEAVFRGQLENDFYG